MLSRPLFRAVGTERRVPDFAVSSEVMHFRSSFPISTFHSEVL